MKAISPKLNNNHDNYKNAAYKINSAGGTSKNCRRVIEKASTNRIEHNTQRNGEELVKESYALKQVFNVEKSQTINTIDPTRYATQQELFDDIRYWWVFKNRKKESTITRRLHYAKKMSEHPVYPVNWIEFNPNQIIAYLEHREYIDYQGTRGKHQIRNEWKTVNTFAKVYGRRTDLWGYTPPDPPSPKVRIIPMPKTTHTMIHHVYSKDRYVNALYQHLLMHGFHIGWRPSELVIQKASEVYLEDGYMVIIETKKGNQPRQIFPDQQLLIGRQCKSLKNWIDYWRPKVVTQYSKDWLYLQQNGRPFTVNYLRRLLVPQIKGVWNHYSLYTMRHWCAIARLIRSYLENKSWDKEDVRDWLGHDHVKTTDEYTKFAKRYYRNASFDWLKATLKFHA